MGKNIEIYMNSIWASLWKNWYRPYIEDSATGSKCAMYAIDWDPVSPMEIRFQLQDLYDDETL